MKAGQLRCMLLEHVTTHVWTLQDMLTPDVSGKKRFNPHEVTEHQSNNSAKQLLSLLYKLCNATK